MSTELRANSASPAGIGLSCAGVSRAAVPAVLLLLYAVAFGVAALGHGVPAFDDHPGQLYRLHHVIEFGWAPWRLNPGWWAGYAELQYYPPGAAWLGAIIHAASLGALDVPRAYETVVWIAWLIPGLTTFALLQRVLGNGWLALPGAFVALTLSAGSRSGVEEGLRWGLVAARLGWGLLPLTALSLVHWVEDARRAPLLAAPLLAAIILVHPAHAPAALALLGTGAWLGHGPRWPRAKQAALVAALALSLTALWLLPLLAHLRMVLPLAWGDGSALGVLRQMGRPLVVALVLAQVAAWISTRTAGDHTIRWLQAFTPAVAAVVLLDALLGASIGARWLPADRLVDSLLLALVIGASLGVPGLAARLPRIRPAGVAFVLIMGAILLSPGSGEPALSLWPMRGQWPKYDEVARGDRLDALWETLRDAPPGRVLFLRSAVRLDYLPEWWRPHSHIIALTPIETGRGIINGTFTHPSPIAGLLYTGSAENRPITMLVEERDGVSLFGRPLESLTAESFRTWADKLGISVVVASEEDAGRLGFLEAGADFSPPRAIGPFRIYVARAPRILPQRTGLQSWRLASPSGAGWRAAGFAYSPLWSAESGGRSLPTRRDAAGMLEIDGPGGASDITLHHIPGVAERIGTLVSALSAAALAVAAVRRRGRGDVAVTAHHSAPPHPRR
jgi:hypothetical protein